MHMAHMHAHAACVQVHLLLAALDPSACWLSSLLSRAHLQQSVWVRLVRSGLLAEAEAVTRTALPAVPPDATTVLPVWKAPEWKPDGGEGAGSRLQPWEAALVHGLHHTCVVALALRHAVAPRDGTDETAEAAPSSRTEIDATHETADETAPSFGREWAASCLPAVLSRLREVMHMLA